jgi:hypothetical protein
MKRCGFALASLTALAIGLHAQSTHIMQASFPDGTRLEIFTEATGSTAIDAEGSMGIGPGTGHQDLIDRIVVDRTNNILFAYNIEASKGASPDTVLIRIDPYSPATEKIMMEDMGPRMGLHFSGAHFPTVAAVREFAGVKIGEAVTLDILLNPSTGEKIYDVLRPIAASPAGRMKVQAVPTAETISLKQVVIRLNGRELSAPASWMIGGAIRIDIPGHGAWVVAAEDPNATSSDRVFGPIAHVEGKTLSWVLDGDRIEVTSAANILAQSANRTLWVYHDLHFRSQDQPDAVRLQAADSVDWLLPNTKR